MTARHPQRPCLDGRKNRTAPDNAKMGVRGGLSAGAQGVKGAGQSPPGHHAPTPPHSRPTPEGPGAPHHLLQR